MKLELDGYHLQSENRETIESAIAHLNLVKIYESEGTQIKTVDVHEIWDGNKNKSLIIKVDYED
jgi:hypothetical protein